MYLETAILLLLLYRVTSDNSAPIVTTILPIVLTVGTNDLFVLRLIDPNGDNLTYTITGISPNVGSGSITIPALVLLPHNWAQVLLSLPFKCVMTAFRPSVPPLTSPLFSTMHRVPPHKRLQLLKVCR